MRSESAASIKASARGRKHQGRTPQQVPREGTRLRALYDLLWENRGRFVDLGTLHKDDINRIHGDLRDYYGLDIRGRRVRDGTRGGHNAWCLAGEWVGRGYIDYCAMRANGEDLT
jgi:hypothetical protein